MESGKLKLWWRYEPLVSLWVPLCGNCVGPREWPGEMTSEDREVRVEGQLKGGRRLEKERDPP